VCNEDVPKSNPWDMTGGGSHSLITLRMLIEKAIFSFSSPYWSHVAYVRLAMHETPRRPTSVWDYVDIL